jgi:hypothetical protein
VPCPFPDTTKHFSVITEGDLELWAHNVYTGLAVGGTLTDGTPLAAAVVAGTVPSVVDAFGSPSANIHFNSGVTTGEGSFAAAINYASLETMAATAVGFIDYVTGFAVFVVDQGSAGGYFRASDFPHPPPGTNPLDLQGEDNGNTLVIFNNTGTVNILKTKSGRQWGPSILAPFAHVNIDGSAGFVDGQIMAKSVGSTGEDARGLQYHGDLFRGTPLCYT